MGCITYKVFDAVVNLRYVFEYAIEYIPNRLTHILKEVNNIFYQVINGFSKLGIMLIYQCKGTSKWIHDE